jgi:hypothetical protein
MITAEQLRVRNIGFDRHAHEHVKVIGHDSVSENLDAAVVGDLPELLAEHLLGGLIETTLAVHGA